MDTQPVKNVGNPLAAKPTPAVTKSPSKTSNPATEDMVRLSKEGQDLALRKVEPSSDSSLSSEQRKFSVTENNDVVLKVIDSKTQKVVKSVPSEDQLQLKDAIRNELENI